MLVAQPNKIQLGQSGQLLQGRPGSFIDLADWHRAGFISQHIKNSAVDLGPAQA